MYSESPHEFSPLDRLPEEQIEVSNYQDLKAAILGFVLERETGGRIIVSNYENEDVQADVDRANYEIKTYHPVGIFAVSDIIGQATRIVAFSQIDITIEYKRTKQQMNSIIYVESEQQLRTELLGIMSDYRDEAVFRTSLQISEQDIIRYIVETYYQNPRLIIMLPIVAVEIYPVVGFDRIIELSLGLFEPARISRSRTEILSSYLESNIDLAIGDSDAEKMLSMVNNLISFSNFDESTASLISEHGAQNWAATASGALVNASAIGEGYAMAFKALCDALMLDCRVVLGFFDGRFHAWNMVSLDGEFYHIDIAMSDVYGLESHFLKTDADFMERYVWDFESTPDAKGTLKYEDIVDMENTEDTATAVEEPESPPLTPPEEPGEGTTEEPGQTIGEPGDGDGQPDEAAI